jgi:hypothetical protein
MIVSAAIQHVPRDRQRRVWCADLVDVLRTNPDLIELRVVPDMGGGLRKTWRAVAVPHPAASHHLTFNDDVLPFPGFWQAVHAMVDLLPDQIICLLTTRRVPTDRLIAEGRSWFVSDGNLWGAGVLYPAAVLLEARAWIDAHISEAYPHDDGAVGLWCRATGRKIWHPVWSLIEHVGDGHSLIRAAARGRVARFPYDAAAGVDWSSGIDRPPLASTAWGSFSKREIERLKAEGIMR